MPVRLVRGRARTPTADFDATRAAVSRATRAGDPLVRVWSPHRQVAFGRRDTRSPGYEHARDLARDRGYAAVERSVGGRVVAYTGRTLAFVHAWPTGRDGRPGIGRRYDEAVRTLVEAFSGLGTDVEAGEPPDSFCPGGGAVRAVGGGKVAGVAQRVRADAVVVAGCVLVDDAAAQRAILDPVYRALGLDFDPESVGDVSTAGGPADPDVVAAALERSLVDGRPTRPEHVGEGGVGEGTDPADRVGDL